MKSLNSNELVSFCEWIAKRLRGAQLQDLWTDGETLVLQFYSRQEVYFLVNLHPSSPLAWLQVEKPRVKKTSKPLTLFLASHGRNLFVRDFFVLLDQGRVLELTLSGGDRECVVRFDLIPKNPNVQVSAGGKSVAWNKPQELPRAQLPVFEKIERDWELWSEEVALHLKTKAGAEKKSAEVVLSSPPTAKSEGQKRVEKNLQKKQKALLSMQEQLQSNLGERFRAFGEVLKAEQGSVAGEWAEMYKVDLSWQDNMRMAFQKAKDLERKRQGTLDRLTILQGEIQDLQRQLALGRFDEMKPVVSKATLAMRKGEAAGRRMSLAQGLEAALGKSGADNLAILRQARAWDLWVHLKDEPGAHAIIFRNRDQVVPPSEIQAVAEWVWRESRGKKSMPGEKYQVVVVECRFVKPIKGDRLGRVTYHHPQVFTFASKTNS